MLLIERVIIFQLLVDDFFILRHPFLEEALIDHRCTKRPGVVKPDEVQQLDEVVEGDELEKNSEHPIANLEKAENHPVREPLPIITAALGFQRLEAHIRRVEEPEERDKETGGNSGENEDQN